MAALAILLAMEAKAAPQILYASPDGRGGYFEGVFYARAKALHVVLADLPRRRSQPLVIQLTTADADPAAVTYYERPVLIESCGSLQASLEIRGVRIGDRWLTRLRGPDLEATKCAPIQDEAARKACWEGRPSPLVAVQGEMLSAIGRVTLPLRPSEFRFPHVGDRNARLPCMSLAKSDHVVLKDLGLESCWLAAVFMEDSQNVTVESNFILGSSYAVIVWNDTDEPARATGYRITDNVWIQDVTGYGPDRRPACREPNATADCPGDMWRLWPWGATHDALWEPYNGALFGGIGVGGDVLFAGNTVRNAYNGIRLYPARACRQGTKCLEQTHRNVRVIGNTFAFVRDNPIEPELHAADWHIAHNRFFNNHSWISTDGVAGGPVYVYGNVAWFSREIPGLACVDGPHWRDLLRFLFEGKREGRYVLARDFEERLRPSLRNASARDRREAGWCPRRPRAAARCLLHLPQ